MSGSGIPLAPLIGFKRHLRPKVVAGDAVYLFSEHGVTAVQGSHLEASAPLLDGTRDLPTLLRDLPMTTTPGQVAKLLTQLTEAGFVSLRAPVAAGTEESTLAYWDTSGLDASAAASATAAGRLQLIAVGDVGAEAARAAFTTADLTVAPASAAALDDTADLSIVLCEDYLDPRLADIDVLHRRAGRPWLLAKPTGARVWIGPIFQPPTGACWRCVATRLWGHRPAEAHVQSSLGEQGSPARRPVASVPPLAATAAHLVALEAMKWLVGYRYPGQQSVWTIDSLNLQGRHHEVRARPQCASCGDPTLVRSLAWRPVRLQPRLKASYGDGGHRSLTPEQVLDRYQYLISPVTGLIKEVQRDRRGPAFFNSYRSGPNHTLGARCGKGLRAALRTENGGKGTTALHAEVGALCEALERYCGSFHGDEEQVPGSYRTLGEQAIHPDSCQLFHSRQYADRTRWNVAHSAFQYVCDPFDEDAVINWTPVWSLTAQRRRLLPTGQLYFGVPAENGRCFVTADSNGNAAGTSVEDAVLQGLLELVERDAVAIWWYNRTRQPAVNLDAAGDPWIEELREVYAGLGREVWVLDVTSDLGIPAMVALSRRTDKPCEDIIFGFGAHLDPRIAMRRALTEMNQLMPAVVEVGAGDDYRCDDADAVHWWRHATVQNQPYLVPDPVQRARTSADFAYILRQDLYEDVRTIQTRLEKLGLEVLVLDQTRPDVGLPVVKVIVPGMRHFWARLAPGRLYDVPVRLGRLAQPTQYEDLNPVPLFV